MLHTMYNRFVIFSYFSNVALMLSLKFLSPFLRCLYYAEIIDLKIASTGMQCMQTELRCSPLLALHGSN